MSLDEFFALPETEPASEFACGEVIQKAMPTRAHGIVRRKVSQHVGNYLDGNDLGEAGSEVRFIFGAENDRRTYLPDFSFVATTRLPTDPESLDGPFIGPPDLAVEILSPDDRTGRVLDKVFFYLDNGVRVVWLMDPAERSIRVYRPDGYRRTLLAGDTLDGGDVLPGFSVPVDDLFPKRPQ